MNEKQKTIVLKITLFKLHLNTNEKRKKDILKHFVEYASVQKRIYILYKINQKMFTLLRNLSNLLPVVGKID